MGRCVRGSRCVVYVRATDTAGLATETPLCEACLGRAGAAIASLPGYWRSLEAELVPAQRGMTQRVAGGDGGGGQPMSLTIDELQRSIFWQLTVWEPPVREAAGLAPERTRGVRDVWAVEIAAEVIAPRVEVLASLPPTWGYAAGLDASPVERDGVQAVAALQRIARAAREACGITRRVYGLPGWCSGCGWPDLRRSDGSNTVYCGQCDRRWTIGDYERYAGLTLASLPAGR